MFLVKILLLVLTINFSLIAFTQEEQGGGGKPAVKSVDYSGNQNQDWVEVQKKLAELKGKLDSQENVVKGLIATSVEAPPEQRNKKNEELVVEHRKLQKMIDEYNERSVEYETKFPEKGVKESRLYKRIDSKSIESMENDMTLDGRLSRLHNKVIRQYPHSAGDTKSSSKGHSKKSKNKTETIAPHEKDVTDPIILQK